MSLADCIDGLGKGRRWVVASVRDLAAAEQVGRVGQCDPDLTVAGASPVEAVEFPSPLRGLPVTHTDCVECRRGEHMPDGSACSCCKTDLTEYLAAFNAAMSPVTA